MDAPHSRLFLRSSRPAVAAALALASLAGVANADPSCGGESQDPCVCFSPIGVPFPCCDNGFGQDPLVVGACSRCWVGSPPFWCNGDGMGQLGEQDWDVGGIENLRTGRTCDRGLSSRNGTCENSDRFSSAVSNFVNTWRWRALNHQRALNNQLPLTQGLFIGTHNSFNNSADGYALFQQTYSMSDQLRAGVRFLNLDCHRSEVFDPIYALARMSHAGSDHLGMSPYDRPFRHGIEEIRVWLDNNPGEILLLHLQNEMDNRGDIMTTEVHSLLGSRMLTRGQLVAEGGLERLTPARMVQLGKRVIAFYEKDGIPPDAVDFFHRYEDILYPGWPDNGVLDFLDGKQYDPARGTSNAWNIRKFTEYEGNSQDSVDDPLPAAVARQMVEAGVNAVVLDPLGYSIAGTIIGEPPVSVPLQDAMDSVIWSWAANEPPLNIGARAAKVRLIRPGMARFVSALPNENLRFIAQSNRGRCWQVTNTSGQFSQGVTAVNNEIGSTYTFGVPGNGFQMKRLADAMQRAGVTEAWVNYHDLDGNNSYTGTVIPEDLNFGGCTNDYYVDPINGTDLATAGTSPDNAWRTIQYAVDRAPNNAIINLAPGTYTLTQTIVIDDFIGQIRGSALTPTIIDGNLQHQLIRTSGTTDVEFHSITFQRSRNGFAAVEVAGSGGSPYAGFFRCSFLDNQGSQAGAIYGKIGFAATQCTFAGNVSTGQGGAILLVGGSAGLSGCTITGNSAALRGGGVTVNGSGSSLAISDSIIWGNTAPSDPDVSRVTGSIFSQRYTFYGAGAQTDVTPAATDRVGVNPQLGALDYHGGSTKAFLLLPGSPAIDVSPFTGSFQDQHYNTRDVDYNRDGQVLADSGSLEMPAPPFLVAYVSPTGSDSNTGASPDQAYRTVNKALQTIDSGGIIYLAPGTYSEPISNLRPNWGATIQGSLLAPSEIRVGSSQPIFDVREDSNLTISDVTLSGTRNAGGVGGAAHVRRDGSLVLQRVTVTDCHAGRGAGVYNEGSLTILSSTISGNSAQNGPAAIENKLGTTTIRNSTIAYNATESTSDGAVTATNGSVSLASTIVAQNTGRNGNELNFSYLNGAAVVSEGFNVLGVAPASEIELVPSDRTDLDPLLKPLAFNGGPTKTHDLKPNSPAIDAGDPNSVTPFDQRGVISPLDGNCDGTRVPDVGAVEKGEYYPPLLTGNALRFDGTNSGVGVGFANAFNFANNFTIEAWIKPAFLNQSNWAGRIFSSRNHNGVGGFGFGESAGRLIFTTFGRQDYITARSYLTVGQWTHVAVVFDASNDAHFYVNGTLVESIPGSLPPTPTSALPMIGRNPGPHGQVVNGILDEVRFWSVPRTSAEIADNMDVPVTSGVGLAGSWRFEEGTGNVTQNFGSEGFAQPQHFLTTWVRVPECTPPCPVDLNNDEQVDFFDYLDFVEAYDVQGPAADFNNDDQVDFFDYLDFAAAFDQGC
ncbi:MAG: LamG-like jellyroll fold domain-containing protein [Planctomycetota bacterium]|nr:LamG-like jellyroll fold domain-containing protein [Planctomycetota bacterium]